MGSRFSTSGGVMMLGGHCIKTWGTTQGAIALSSAEVEFYAMIEAVLRAKGLRTLAMELGCPLKGGCIKLATHSSAAKSFVSRMGFWKDEASGDQGPLVAEGSGRWKGEGLEDSRRQKPRRPDDEELEDRRDTQQVVEVRIND